MNRRGLFKALAGVVAAYCIGKRAASEPKWGAVDVQRWVDIKRTLGIELHVWHAGRDITKDCMFADDTGDGMAEVLLRDCKGRAYLGADRKVAKEILRGVRFIAQRAS
jgi:hypothetical protein